MHCTLSDTALARNYSRFSGCPEAPCAVAATSGNWKCVIFIDFTIGLDSSPKAEGGQDAAEAVWNDRLRSNKCNS